MAYLSRRHKKRPSTELAALAKTPLPRRRREREGTAKPRKVQTNITLASALLLVFLCFKLNHTFRASFQHVSDFQQRPILVLLENRDARHLRLEENPVQFIQKQQKNQLRKSESSEDSIDAYPPLKRLKEGCEYIADWKADLHPSCNKFHEIDATDFFMNRNRTMVRVDGVLKREKMSYISSGSFRDAFMITECDGSRRVLKSFTRHRTANHPNIEMIRSDAVIMEQLTASPYIANIHGYCALSSLADYSNGHDLSMIFEQEGQLTKESLFQVAYDVAASVADMHHPNEQGRPTVAHQDIKPDQWVLINGMYVLQDFNLARFLTWNPTRDKNCGWAFGWEGGRWHAPEQYTGDVPLTDKADVYALGAVLYFLLTRRKPFLEKDREEVTEILKNGGVLKLDDQAVMNSTHPFDVTVREAVIKCLDINPEKRPSAREVADMVGEGLSEFNLVT